MSSDTTPTVIPQKGDWLSFPNTPPGNPITVEWQQILSKKSAQYYEVTAYDATQGGNVLVYVQKEWLDPTQALDNHHVCYFTPKPDGTAFNIVIDDRFQYGQRNAAGECRFIVYHDKSRKMYQHRFLATTMLGKGSQWAKQYVHDHFPAGNGADAANIILDQLSSYLGDFLHTF